MSSIYAYIDEQKAAYAQAIPIEDGWYWNMKEHLRRSFLYKHAQFEKNNENRSLRPFKNIIRPILNVQYRTEGFDVKDVDPYVDNADNYHKSFLVKKKHDRWALENGMDTFLDDLVQSYVDYGGVLVRNTGGVRPEVIDLKTIAFCDQTDLLSGPFAIRHYLTPSQLKDMKKRGWGTTGATMDVDTLIYKAAEAKKRENGEAKTPGRYIEVYEIHNVAERDFDITSDDETPMMYVCSFFQDETGNPQGVTLFSNREPKLPFKFTKRDPVHGRALGYGGIEELFEPQVWTNFSEIAVMGMLEHASKILYLTDDKKFKNQNLTGKPTGSVLDLQKEGRFEQLDNIPRNLNAFTNKTVDMHQHAMEIGAASDLALGRQPTSGTPFKSVETQLVEGNSLHLWRQGRIATFVEEIYRDWIIPHLAKTLMQSSKWLAELSGEELMEIAERMSKNQAIARIKKAVIEGKVSEVSREKYEEMKLMFKDQELKKGDKRFLEILKNDLKDIPLAVRTNIVGKQKNLALLTDKLVNYVRQLIATPEMRQDQGLMNHLNEILETSGLSPIVYAPKMQAAGVPAQGPTGPLKEFTKVSEQRA